jgi:tetratricopeptide (TPR) repeat protein
MHFKHWRRTGMKSQRQLVVVALLATVATAVQAQGSYSEAGEKPYIDRKDWRGLLGYTQAWTRAEPNNPVAWYGLAMTYRVGFNQPREAADAFRRALVLRPEWPQAWAGLSASYSYMPGRPSDVNAKVLATLREERQHMSRASANDWFQLGLNFDNAGSIFDHEPYREAISAYNQSLNMNASSAETWNNRGSAEASLGDYAAALSDYQHASQLGLALGAKNYNGLKQALAAQAEAAKANAASPRTMLGGMKTCSVLLGDGYGNWHRESRSGSQCP